MSKSNSGLLKIQHGGGLSVLLPRQTRGFGDENDAHSLQSFALIHIYHIDYHIA